MFPKVSAVALWWALQVLQVVLSLGYKNSFSKFIKMCIVSLKIY